MSDRDIVAELRRLYDDSTTDGDRSWLAVENDEYCDIFSGRRAIDVGRIVAAEDARLIVAMHNHLPALLAAIDTLRWYADKGNYDDGCPGDLGDDGRVQVMDNGSRARAALAALERSDG